METPKSDNLIVKQSEANWNLLPMEMKAKIVGYLNIKDSLQLKRCSHEEAELVNQFARQELRLFVSFGVGSVEDPLAVKFSVTDKFGDLAILIQVTDCESSTQTEVSFYKVAFMQKYQEGEKVPKVASNILRWILTEKMFNITMVKSSLGCGTSREDLTAMLHSCFRGSLFIFHNIKRVYSADRKVDHISIFCAASYWLTKSDLDIVMKARSYPSMENEEQRKSQHEGRLIFHMFKWSWMSFSSLIRRTIGSFETALQIVKSMGREFAELEHVFAIDDVKNKVESEKAVDTMMYFIRAYRADGIRKVTYLNNKPDSAQKIAFLKEGLEKTNGELDTFQLTLLIFLFSLRLVLDHPEVPKVYGRACDGFQYVLNQHQEANYFVKFLRKLEILVEDIGVIW